MALEDNLDKKIKDVLKNLEVEYDPKSWDAFEQQLKAEEILHPADFDNAYLDGLVMQNLDNLEKEIPPPNWELMEQQLEAADALENIESDAVVDELTHEKLQNLTVAYHPSHWPMLAQRLREELSLKKKLYKYKVTEAALMLLLLLTMVNYFPPGERFQRPTAAMDEIQEPNPPSPVLPEFSVSSSAQLITAPTKRNGFSESSTVESPPTLSKKEKPAPSKISGGIITSSKGGTKTAQKESAANHLIPPFERGPQFIESVPSKLPLLSYLAIPKILLPEELVGRSLKMATPQTTADKNETDSPLPSPIESLTPQLLNYENAVSLPLVQPIPAKKKKQIRFSFFSSVDYNLVFSPKEIVFDTVVGKDVTDAYGYGGGITFSVKKGRWEFETGGLYTFKRYVPKTPDHQFEKQGYYVFERFEGIQLDILQVPMNLHYHFINRPKWKLYGVFGASLHMVMSPVYEIKQTRILAFASPLPPDGNFNSLKDEKQFPKGILGGGSFKENSYLSGNLGLGLERYLSPRWSIFLQPNYQHYFSPNGIGPNKDKIYTLSFFLGTKVNLK